MKKNNRSNSLLMELMLAALFFMLGTVVLVEIFAAAGKLSKRADMRNCALPEAQSLADRFWAADDGAALLTELCVAEGDGYAMDCGDFRLNVTLETESAAAGSLAIAHITAVDAQGYELAQLDSAKYIPGEAK